MIYHSYLRRQSLPLGRLLLALLLFRALYGNILQGSIGFRCGVQADVISRLHRLQLRFGAPFLLLGLHDLAQVHHQRVVYASSSFLDSVASFSCKAPRT
jgi:hypothetical protein